MNILRMLLIYSILLCVLLLSGAAVAAESTTEKAVTSGFSIGLGGSVSTSPYKRYETQWMPLPMVSYEGKYAYIRGLSAGVKLVNTKVFELSAFGSYNNTDFTHHDTSDTKLRRLSDRYASLLGGVGSRVTTPVGMLQVNLAGDATNNSNGFTGDISYFYALDLGRIEFTPSAGLYWNSAKYNQYYYGVSKRESRKSGLDAYRPDQGVSPYVSLMTELTLSDAWALILNGEIVFLGDEIRNSSMVDKSHTESFSAGIMFEF